MLRLFECFFFFCMLRFEVTAISQFAFIFILFIFSQIGAHVVVCSFETLNTSSLRTYLANTPISYIFYDEAQCMYSERFFRPATSTSIANLNVPNAPLCCISGSTPLLIREFVGGAFGLGPGYVIYGLKEKVNKSRLFACVKSVDSFVVDVIFNTKKHYIS